MTVTIWQVDSFADEVFEGNPAAVCILDEWLPDQTMLNIAMENNLSETAFAVLKSDTTYELRWFTPAAEVDLCGHATLATAYILFEHYSYAHQRIAFETRSGILDVEKLDNGLFIMDFPSDHAQPLARDNSLDNLFDVDVIEWYQGKDDLLAITHSEKDVQRATPNIRAMEKLKQARGIILTARGEAKDFVSRCFYPLYGIDEDPVTGSAHTVLTPYWAIQQKKNRLQARQISARGGNLECIYKGNRTALIGKAVLYMKGELFL